MPDQDPQSSNDSTPDPLKANPAQFFAGVIGGILVSFFYWTFVFHHHFPSITAMLILPIAKIVASAAFHFTRNYKPLGTAIFVSMFLGFMIFFGHCAQIF